MLESICRIRLEGIKEIDEMISLLNKAKEMKASKFDLEVGNCGGLYFVEWIEFYRVKSEREILTEERNALEERIIKINDILYNLPPNPIPDHEVTGGESD